MATIDMLTNAQQTIAARYTTTQTGVALVTPPAGKRVVVVYYQIQAGGTTAGEVVVWFGASGDTTYTRGTDIPVFDGEFAPSATLKPGVIAGVGDTQTPLAIGNVNDILRVTDSAAINPLTVTITYYFSA